METFVILGTFSGPMSDAQTMKMNMAKLSEGAEKLGVKVSNMYMVMGRYDMVLTVGAPNAQTAAKFAMLLASTGVHTETLRAFSAEEAMAMM